MNAPARGRPHPEEVTHELVVVADDPRRAEALVRQLGLPDAPVFDAAGVGEWALVPARTLVLWEVVPDRDRLRRRIQIGTASSHVVVVAGVEHPEVIELTLREGATILTWPGSDAALAGSLRECLRGRVDKPRSRAVVLDSQRLADELHRALSRRLDRSSPSIQIADVARMDGLIDRLTSEILSEAQAAPVAALDWDDMPTAVQTPEESGRFRTMAAAAARRGRSGSLTRPVATDTEQRPTRVTTRFEPPPEPRRQIRDDGYDSIMETAQYPPLPPPPLPDLDKPLPGADATVRDLALGDGAVPDAGRGVELEGGRGRDGAAARPAVESLRPSRPRRGPVAPLLALALASGVAAGVALFFSARANPTAGRSETVSTPEPRPPGALSAIPSRPVTARATSVHAPASGVAPRSDEAHEPASHSQPAAPRTDPAPRRPTRAQRAQRAAARARGHLAHGRPTAALRAARVAHRLARGAPAYAALLAEVEGEASAGDTSPAEEATVREATVREATAQEMTVQETTVRETTAQEMTVRETTAQETTAEETGAPDAAAPEAAGQRGESPETEADEPPTNPYRTGERADRPTG